MFRISSPPLLLLAAASLLAMVAGCQRWVVVSIGLDGPFDPYHQVSRVRARVFKLGPGSNDAGNLHDGTEPPNAPFKQTRSVGVYLPVGVRQFAVQIDLYYLEDCPFLSGSRNFNLDAPPDSFVVRLSPSDPCLLSDAGTDADASPGLTDGPADGKDALDLIPDSVETATDTAECGTDTQPTVVACFDPSDPDAGTATPFTGRPTNPECDSYCADMMANCQGTFADLSGCLTVCTEADWHLPVDGSAVGTTLSCLAEHARMASGEISETARRLYCGRADPSAADCVKPCMTYCALRRQLCKDLTSTENDCVVACSNLDSRPRFIPCLIQVLQHDVPGDTRYCSWTPMSATCERCSGF